MINFTSMVNPVFSLPVQLATEEDIPAMVALLNSAYRGESSRQGWTTETHLIGGEVRTTEASLQEVLQVPGSVMLKYIDEQGRVVGCVNLQLQEDRIYLGMFSVDPVMQGAGIGKQLLAAAMEYACFEKCHSIYMTVISVRTELVNWYKRHGYVDTGIRKPFEEDGITGRHLQPLEFMVLEKTVS